MENSTKSSQKQPKKKLSVVIPTFNEKSNPMMDEILSSLPQSNDVEVLFCDGSSEDNTVARIRERGFTVLEDCGTSRAARLNRGVEEAEGSMILLQHPRSVLGGQAYESLVHQNDRAFWGGFTHKFDRDHILLSYTSWYSNRVRPKTSGILYLDHCIFFHHSFKVSPMMPDVDIFEDTELSLVLRKNGSPSILSPISKTSAIRFNKNGVAAQLSMNQLLKIGYHANVPDVLMNKIYELRTKLNNRYD